MAAILDFPLPVWWKIILSSSVGLLDPENIGVEVEIAFLYCLYKLRYEDFQFKGRLLGFSLLVTSESFNDSSIGMAVIENGGSRLNCVSISSRSRDMSGDIFHVSHRSAQYITEVRPITSALVRNGIQFTLRHISHKKQP